MHHQWQNEIVVLISVQSMWLPQIVHENILFINKMCNVHMNTFLLLDLSLEENILFFLEILFHFDYTNVFVCLISSFVCS